MSLIVEDKSVVNAIYWCSACGRFFGNTMDRNCVKADKHLLVVIYVEADSTLDEFVSVKDFGEGD
jgi:hypothetical protein